MDKNLFFIALIDEALKKPNPKFHLKEAFAEIMKLGAQTHFEQGFSQFQCFITEVGKNWERGYSKLEDAHFLQDMAFQIATDIFAGDLQHAEKALELIRRHPELNYEYETFCKEAERSEAISQPVGIDIKYDGKYFASCSLSKSEPVKKICKIYPGAYSIQLSTGRRIWQDELTEKDLLWGYAFPEREIKLAADTGETIEGVSRQINLLKGEMTLRIIPQIESGCIEFILRH